MRLWYNIMLFTILFNISVWLLQIFQIVRFDSPLWSDPTGFQNLFTIDYFIRSFTYAVAGAAAIGLAQAILRVGVNPIYAMLIWAVGVFVPIIQQFLLAVPTMIEAVIPRSMNPIYPLPNPFSVVFGAMFAFGAFMFLMEMVTQTRHT